MEYFVTGATGFIGTNLVEQAVADGHDVVALTRSRSNARHLPNEVTVVEGDVTEKESMRDGMDGVDGVFHLAAWLEVGPGPWNEAKVERINVEGTRNVLELIDELDVPKGVYASSIAIYGNAGDEVVDESYRASNSFPSVYQETKWRAHYEVAEPMIDDGLPLVITTLGAIYGPGDKLDGGTPRTAFRGYLLDELPGVPKEFTMGFDYVEDTARMLLKAMADGTPGEEYIIANEPRNLAEILERAEEITGVAPPRTVPDSLVRFLSHGVAALETVTKLPGGLQSELLRFFASGPILTDNTKAKRELGIEHRPFEDGLREYLEWELEQIEMEKRTTERSTEEIAGDPVS